jgi:transposase-like protein
MHSPELKAQIVKEIQEVGNISLVCKKHGLKPSTVHGWLHSVKNKVQIADKKQSKADQRKIKDLELQVEVLTALLKKTYPLWNNEKQLS